MKQKTKKRYFEAASLLLAILFLVNTCVQSLETAEIKTETIENKKPEKTGIINLVIGSGLIEYIYPENLENFKGDSWYNEYDTGSSEGIKGWIKNTDIYAGEFVPSFEYRWFLMIFPRIILPDEFIIKDFSGFICLESTYINHGPCIEKFILIGMCKGIQKK